MPSQKPLPSAPFNVQFFPLHLALLTVGENMMPMGYWTVISKEPFRFLLSISRGNYTLLLLQEIGEGALHFMPWSERERVVRAGQMSGRDVNKAQELGFTLFPAEVLKQTQLVHGADSIFELIVYREMADLSREYVQFVMDVVATHGKKPPVRREPILFFSRKDFATSGERWQSQK